MKSSATIEVFAMNKIVHWAYAKIQCFTFTLSTNPLESMYFPRALKNAISKWNVLRFTKILSTSGFEVLRLQSYFSSCQIIRDDDIILFTIFGNLTCYFKSFFNNNTRLWRLIRGKYSMIWILILSDETWNWIRFNIIHIKSLSIAISVVHLHRLINCNSTDGKQCHISCRLSTIWLNLIYNSLKSSSFTRTGSDEESLLDRYIVFFIDYVLW